MARKRLCSYVEVGAREGGCLEKIRAVNWTDWPAGRWKEVCEREVILKAIREKQHCNFQHIVYLSSVSVCPSCLFQLEAPQGRPYNA